MKRFRTGRKYIICPVDSKHVRLLHLNVRPIGYALPAVLSRCFVGLVLQSIEDRIETGDCLVIQLTTLPGYNAVSSPLGTPDTGQTSDFGSPRYFCCVYFGSYIVQLSRDDCLIRDR